MRFFTALHDYCYASLLKIGSHFNTTELDSFSKHKPTVILLPGVYENWFYFRKLAGYNVLHADKIYKSQSIAKDAARLAQFIKDKSLKDVVLIGHSSGGITALKTLASCKNISLVIAIATPFAGVTNGHFLRTKLVRELLHNSPEIQFVKSISAQTRAKVVLIYPKYDNQIWNKSGSKLQGAKNIELKVYGHHLILKSDILANKVVEILSSPATYVP